jgi:class 3 adenylate cyclase/tetratricopeptide (TPR) repeat protein
VKCSRCGFDNATGLKFCGECGGALKVACASCGFENQPGTKFCGECGKAVGGSGNSAPPPDPRSYTPKHLAEKILSSRGALEGERKQVTVLFADLKGSMDLSESIDPEDWHGIMERFFRILSDGVHRFEGTVNQYTGDGIMALFGAPIAHEDHAARACYAALSLQDDLRRYANELRLAKAISFSVRMGLNSGEVVVGKIGDDLRMDYTALGHTASLGARMEQIAEPGKAYLSEHTAKLVEGLVTLQDLGKLAVKGVKEPLRVYELQGIGRLKTHLEVSRARGFSKFVGRSSEMAVLEGALERALQGSGQVVGIVADPGVGKSRLCFEFVERCRARGIFVNEGHCPAHGKTIPYVPILELWRSYFGITERDSNEEARRKIAGTLLLLDPGLHESLPLVFEFLGVTDAERPAPQMDPEAKERRLFALLRDVIQLQTERQPLIVLIDDLHWIDRASDGWITQLAELTNGRRFLLLLNFRPEYDASWMKRSWYQQLPLLPLGREAVAELLASLLGNDPSLAELGQRIRERTGGNPFFIEEVVQSLAEPGSLEGAKGHYRLARPIETIEIPTTVQAVLAARIDRLPEREKRLLQTAAVIGKVFPESILKRVAGIPDHELRASLAALEQAELVFAETLYPEAEYAFKHPLTQEVAYHSQLRERRARIHETTARAIGELFADKPDEQAAVLAHHSEAAGNALEAARWHRRAAEWAGKTNIAEALRHWQAVRRLLHEIPESAEASALAAATYPSILGLGWRLGGSEEETAAVFSEGRALAERSGDPAAVARLVGNYAMARSLAGSPADNVSGGLEMLRFAEQTDDAGLKLAAKGVLATAYYWAGDFRQMLRYCEEGIAASGDDPDLGRDVLLFSPLAHLLFLRGISLAFTGRVSRAVSALEHAVQVARQAGDLNVLSWIEPWRAIVGELGADPGKGEEHAGRAFDAAEKTGSALGRAIAAIAVGVAKTARGSWVEAGRAFDEALAIVRSARAGISYESFVLARLTDVHLAQGDSRRALEVADEAISTARRHGTAEYELRSHLARARALSRGVGADAKEEIAKTLIEAEALVKTTGAESWRPFIHEERARLAQLAGDEATRDRELREAQRLFLEIGAPIHAERIAKELPS